MNPAPSRKPRREVYADTPPDALERLAMVGSCTAWRVPGQGSGRDVYDRITPADVGAAMGAVARADWLGVTLALMMAYESGAEIAGVRAGALAPLRAALAGDKHYCRLIAPPRYGYRLHLVLADVLDDMAAPGGRRRASFRRMSKAHGMQESAYRALYHYIHADLDGRARTAAREICARAFGG